MSEQLKLESSIRPDLLLSLPRELRDDIYADALWLPYLVELAQPTLLQWIPPVLQGHPILLAESLEALYKINTVTTNLADDFFAGSTSVFAQAKAHIRTLVVHCDETSSVVQTTLEAHEELMRTHVDRLRWEQLYEMPHLQELRIYMKKTRDATLDTHDFGPVLYELRARRPGFKITFHLTFDTILKSYWDSPIWTVGETSHQYEWMGYVNMSDLIEPPTDEDREYVDKYMYEYWEDKVMPPNRSIKIGLLDESPVHRRTLARNYAVKEPALLRLHTAEHYKVYKSCRE